MSEQDGINEALTCSVSCEESGNPSFVIKGDDVANGLKEALHFFGCREYLGPSPALAVCCFVGCTCTCAERQGPSLEVRDK